MSVLSFLASLIPARGKLQMLRVAHQVYVTIVAQARQPFLYTEAGIEDDVDGRFDSIVLHVALMVHRLDMDESDHANKAEALAHELVGVFNDDMDRNLREMGVGDLSGGKHVKKMEQACVGRVNVYREALKTRDAAELNDAIHRNVFRGRDVGAPQIEALGSYAMAYRDFLDTQDTQRLVHGKLDIFDYAFPSVAK